MELIQGCRTKTEQRRLQKELSVFHIVWPQPEVCNEALLVFSRFYLSHGLGLLDALIGQLAVALDVPLCSFNQKHYGTIPRLRAIQPYAKS